MKLLILGGTRFLGRHLVDLALARGVDVTIFTRGRLPVPWGDRVTALTGDRDPRAAPGLDALTGGSWDAVIDCSGYVPRVVEASARLLASRVKRYVFVSSMSVYAKTERPQMDERTPLADIPDDGNPVLAIASLTPSTGPAMGGMPFPVSQIAIELYRPLRADPKESRRERVKAGRKERDSAAPRQTSPRPARSPKA